MAYGLSTRFISTYLDSPIIKNERDKFLETLLLMSSGEKVNAHPAAKKKAKQILAVVDGDPFSALDPDLYPSFDVELRPVERLSEIKDSHRMGEMVFNQASEGARRWGSGSGLGVDFFSLDNLDGTATDWYNKMRLFEELIQAIATSKARGNPGLCQYKTGNLFFMGDEYFGIIKIDQVTDWYVVAYSQLLMFKDMYYGRFNALVAANQIYRSIPLTEAIKDCLGWFFKCLAVYGNKGYEVAKGIESLSKANLIRINDQILGEDGSYDAQLEGIRKKERDLGKREHFLVDELDSILRRNLEVAESVELFGLQKLSGHPLLDPEVGGRSVREEAKKKIVYKYSDVRRLRNNCCRLYLEGYIRREKRWPGLRFSGESKRTKLFQLYSLEERNINRNSYPIEDWEDVRFEKHLDFDYYPNFTDLMDDKSISYYRDEAAATWNTKMKTRSHRRLLLEMLSRPNISIYEIVTRVRQGDIPWSWFIVSLYPKEREFKIAARMFSMMVFEMRAYFTATEANMADHVFPSLPQQTMTLSKQEIQELFHKVTEASSDEDLERLFLEIDLTRWNLRWHPEVVDPVGQDLDDMFGLPGAFTTIHHFFERCLILVRVPVCKPVGVDLADPPESDLLFYNHEVGFEGIGQKPWTFLTYGMIDLGAGELASRYYLIGAADNQIVLMSINCSGVPDRKEHIRAVSKLARDRIQEECLKVGQEAKPDECLESTSVVTYGKDVHISGVEYFTSIKAHSRVFPHSSSDFPSLDGSVGAISGQCLSAGERTKEPMNSFALWCFHAALYLVRIKETLFVETSQLSRGWKDVLTSRVIYGLMILPGDLGGTQIAPVTSFFYKGGADPLSKSYASLKFYQHCSGLSRKFIYSLRTKKWFDKEPDLDTLLDDPYGLPLTRPSTAENSVYTASRSKVHGVSKNKDIKELTSAKVDQYGEDLRAVLKSCKPFNPVLLSDILGWSVVGAQDMISRMFTSTRTIQELLQGDEEVNVCSRILSSGTGHFLNTVARITTSIEGEAQISSVYRDVEEMRAWWTQGTGVIITGVTSYTPFDLPLVIDSGPSAHPGFKSMSLPLTTADPFHTRGPEDPYIGRATVEKRSEHGFKIVTSSAPERAVKRLADIATQPGVSISFKNMISKVAQSRAMVDLDGVYPIIGNAIGGTIGHRYASRLGFRSANGLGTLSFASTCFLVNDCADPVSGGERDVPVMVQEMMVAQIGLLVMNRRQHAGPLYCTIRTDCTDWTFLPDEVVEVTELRDMQAPFLTGNVLATAEHITLQRTHGPYPTPFISPLKDTSSVGYSPRYAFQRIVGRALEHSNSAFAVADRGRGSIQLRLDLLELRGIGLRESADAMAAEVGLTLVEAMFSKSRSELRWTPVPLAESLAGALSKCLVRSYLHPMFRTDPFVVEVLRPSSLKYNFSGHSPLSRFKNYIACKSLMLFRDPSSTLYTDKEVLFSDDRSGISSRLAVRRFKAILLQGVISGQCKMETAISILRVQVPKALRSEPTEEGRLSSFYRLCIVMADWSEEVLLPFLHEQFTSLYTGSRLFLCGITAVEVLREVRSVQRVQGDAAMHGMFESVHAERVDTSSVECSTAGAPEVFHHFNISTLHTTRMREFFEIDRLQGRLYGRDSAAGYSYTMIAEMCRDKICVIVGCGYGSGAAVAIVGGAALVFGLDLWGDCEERSSMSGMIDPPAISFTQTTSRFVRIPTTPKETGDIRLPETAHLINRHTGDGTIYLIDVPVKSSSDLVRILSTCSLLSGNPRVLIRLIASHNAISEAWCSLELARATPCMYLVSSNQYMAEVWMDLRVPSVISLTGVTVTRGISFMGHSTESADLQFLGGGRQDVLRLVEGPYYELETSSVEAGVLSTGDILAMSVGDLDHRFTYSQWTETIHVLVARRVLDSENPADLIRALTRQDSTTVSIGLHVIPVSMTPALRLLLTKVLPRLL